MKKVLKLAWKIGKLFIELAIFSAAGYLMLHLTYYFGWLLLPVDQGWGNDIPSALNNLYYLKAWYPPIPNWVYLWTGGVPFMKIYPGFPFLLAFFIHRLFSFSVYGAVKLVMFFSIPVAALGVVALGRILTKNWWVGILAGALMILSPDSWLWITYGGFYAVASSVPFFAWTLVFFSWSMDKKNKWLMVLAAVFFGLTWLFHPMAGILVSMTMAILGLGFGFRDHGFKGSWKGVVKTLIIIALGFTLFAFWILPFLTREDIGSGGISLSYNQMYRSTFRELLGLDWPFGTYNTTTLFAGSAIVLFVIGSVLVFFRKSILRWAVLASGVALFIMTAPSYALPIVKIFQVFWVGTNVRSALILRILGPIIGAYGAMSLSRPFFWVIEKIHQRLISRRARGKPLKDYTVWRYSTKTIGAIVGLAFFLVVFQSVIISPSKSEDSDFTIGYSGYGPMRNWLALKRVDGEIMTLNKKTGEWTLPVFKDHQTIIKELPQIFTLVGGEGVVDDSRAHKVTEAFKVSNKERIDISPFEGELTGSLGNYSQVAMIPTYMGTSLIQRMVGWEISCVYYDENCHSEDIEDLYRWWGITQVWPGGVEEIRQRFDAVKTLKPESKYLGKLYEKDFDWLVYYFQDSTGLASVTNKPVVLVIGDNPPNNDVYDSVFRVMPRIGWGYQKAWTVDGSQRIDDYSLAQLTQFEAIILHGYQTKNQKKAWRLLEKYVNQGGRLLVNTGWKYYADDWGRESKEDKSQYVEWLMPDPFPVQKTVWTSFGKSGLTFSSDLGSENLEDWADLTWEGYDWSMATAQKSWLKPEARVILSVGDQVLMAEQNIGQGKILWTGFDFFGHLLGRRSDSEEKFLEKALESLMGEVSFQEKKLDFERVSPDIIKIGYSQLDGRNKLMFKEVNGGYWGTKLILADQEQKLMTHKAGPGWRMVFLPESPQDSIGEVTFYYRRSKIEWIGMIVSILGVLGLLGYGISKIINKNWERQLQVKAKEKLAKRLKKFRKSWNNEE
ncbi:6-pyruvoyl-tetrahydropterin synthase-related protein [Patescibacteria group bacterium]